MTHRFRVSFRFDYTLDASTEAEAERILQEALNHDQLRTLTYQRPDVERHEMSSPTTAAADDLVYEA